MQENPATPDRDSICEALYLVTGRKFYDDITKQMLVSEDTIAETREQAREVRQQTIPQTLFDETTQRWLLALMKYDGEEVFAIPRDGIPALWQRLQEILPAVEGGPELLDLMRAQCALDASLQSIQSWREAEGMETLALMQQWKMDRDAGVFYLEGLTFESEKYLGPAKQYLNKVAADITGHEPGSESGVPAVRVRQVQRERFPLSDLTGIDFSLFESSIPASYRLEVPIEAARDPRFQEALASPYIRGPLSDVLNLDHVFINRVSEVFPIFSQMHENYADPQAYYRPLRNRHIAGTGEQQVGYLAELPERFVETFNALIEQHAPDIEGRATIERGDNPNDMDTACRINFPKAAFFNTEMLAACAKSRCFEGLYALATTHQSFTPLPEELELLSRTKKQPGDPNKWRLTADMEKDTCQFELPLNKAAMDAAQQVVDLLNTAIEARCERARPSVAAGFRQRLEGNGAIRIEDGNLVIPVTAMQDFDYEFEQSKRGIQAAFDKVHTANRQRETPG